MVEEKTLSPGILSVLPLIYVGWSDSVLSPSEVKLIQKKINAFDFLNKKEKQYLNQWTDPVNPPSDREFKYWEKCLRASAIDLDHSKKTSLISLGLEIAESGALNASDAPKTKQGLLELQSALGLTSQSDRTLLQKLFPEIEQEDICSECDFDPKELKLILDADKVELKDRIRKLLRDPLFEIMEENDKDIYRLRILQQIKELAAQGLSAYSFPKKYGGFEKKNDHIAVFEMLGYGDLSLSIKFGVQFGLFGGAVYQLGTEKHHAKYVEALHSAELLGCFAMTETGHGSNVKNLETTATYDHSSGKITIHSPNFAAGKEYIGNAMHSSMAAVFAQLIVNGENHGVHCVLVPIRDKNGNLLPGVEVKDCGTKLGLNGVDNGRIWFNQVQVPAENLLNKYGDIDQDGNYISPIKNPSKRFFTMLGALVVGRICVGLLGVNASKVALTIATKYAFKRRQFGPDDKPENRIIDYPTHQKRLFPLIANTYGYYFALQDLANKYCDASENEMREVETLAAGLKSKGTWHATEAIQICREACGGKGYLFENRFASLKADSDIFTTFEGDNTVLMQLVAKGLLTEFKQSFHDDGYKAVVRFLYTKFRHDMYELNPIFKRKTDSEHLLDKDFYFHAFKYRQKKVLITLSERMRKFLKRGMDPAKAFLRVQNHMVDLGDAFIDLEVLKSFYSRIQNCENANTKSVLTTLFRLYALENIQKHKGWFLESDYMDGAKSKAIRRTISKLYMDIKPNALGLVDAFAIPDELIKAPIALQDVS